MQMVTPPKSGFDWEPGWWKGFVGACCVLLILGGLIFGAYLGYKQFVEPHLPKVVSNSVTRSDFAETRLITYSNGQSTLVIWMGEEYKSSIHPDTTIVLIQVQTSASGEWVLERVLYRKTGQRAYDVWFPRGREYEEWFRELQAVIEGLKRRSQLTSSFQFRLYK